MWLCVGEVQDFDGFGLGGGSYAGRSFKVFSGKTVHKQHPIFCVMKCLVFLSGILAGSGNSIMVSGPVSLSSWNFGFSLNSIACGYNKQLVSQWCKNVW